ncbi:MAG: non-canonical purine NTP pyrophosphatase [Flavobacteriia bacterium]|nr:MAG: non-canonical purine NTP pyrophosphatase [Flavobacteriia bacterium]
MKKLVFATNNKHKLEEVRQMLPQFDIVGLEAIGCTEDIPETADTFSGNAALKADYITQKYGLDCFADDSGLQVEALNNEPGIYSARYAGEPVNHDKNIDMLLVNLKGVTNRKARFVTVIALNLNGEKHYFEGVVNGEIIDHRQGKGGFGYDPVFRPDGYDITFAEMTMEDKSAISHRGRAVKQLIQFLKANTE